jgi:enolase
VAGLRHQRRGAADAGGIHRARRLRARREVAIALDIAASDFGRGGRYTLGLEHRELDSDGLIELLLRWCERFPIASIEDPLAEDDADAFARFTRAAGHRLQVVGDDFLVSSAALLREPRRRVRPTPCCSSPTSAAR